MIKYAILMNPGHSRVYFEASKKLSMAELNICISKFASPAENAQLEELGGVFYLTFEAEKPLSEEDFYHLRRLSFIFAIFVVEKVGDSTALIPCSAVPVEFMDRSISSILKYTGKTNELFTRLMINLAVMSCTTGSEKIKLLDPIAGKGTTLYEGLIAGYDVSGVEIGEKSVAEAVSYLKKYLETEKFVHTSANEKVSGANKSFSAKKHTINLAKNRRDMKEGKSLTFTMVSGDSRYTDKYFKQNSFDVIVGDLPYGVQHGNVTGGRQTTPTRNPSELVDVCADAWYKALKKGGAIALAWNSFVLPYEKLGDVLKKHGFRLLDTPEYRQFEHMVDRSIKRDIIIAVK